MNGNRLEAALKTPQGVAAQAKAEAHYWRSKRQAREELPYHVKAFQGETHNGHSTGIEWLHHREASEQQGAVRLRSGLMLIKRDEVGRCIAMYKKPTMLISFGTSTVRPKKIKNSRGSSKVKQAKEALKLQVQLAANSEEVFMRVSAGGQRLPTKRYKMPVPAAERLSDDLLDEVAELRRRGVQPTITP